MIAGPTGRRRWPDGVKARSVAETLEAGARVNDVARRHGVQPQQVTAWRRLARQGMLAIPADGEVAFATLMVDASSAATGRAGMMEIEVDGAVVRLPADAPAERIGAIVRALPAPVTVPAQAVRVVIATKPVDFRKGHDGLAALAQNELGLDPHSGPIAVFRSKRGDRIEVLLWDGSGLVMVDKRLETGRVA